MDLERTARNAGVSGVGGGNFPTHVKLRGPADTVIANGAECEPFLQADRQVVALHAPRVLMGLLAVMDHKGAREGVIVLKKRYEEADKSLRAAIAAQGAGDRVRIHYVPDCYPAGDEQQLVYAVTGRVVPRGGLPGDVGAAVFNVGTLMNLANALRGKRYTEKYVTVAGAVKTPCTLMVPVGTRAAELLAAAGGVTEPCVFIVGGPCMGVLHDTEDFAVTKAVNGILALPKDHPYLRKRSLENDWTKARSACAHCNKCTPLCPRNALGLNVQPHKLMRALANGVEHSPDYLGAFACSECGVCRDYVCTDGLNPVKAMQELKARLTKAGLAPDHTVPASPDRNFETRNVPFSRLLNRMGLEKYDVPAPLNPRLMNIQTVRIPLDNGFGPAKPVVKKGDWVRKGRLIADIPDQAVSVKMHASLSGRVTAVTRTYIEIRREKKPT